LHLGVNAVTGQIVAAALTSKEVDDAVQVGPLLDQVTGSLSSVTADGAYDQDGVYANVADRHPEAAVIVPPRCTAVLSDKAATAASPSRHPRTTIKPAESHLELGAADPGACPTWRRWAIRWSLPARPPLARHRKLSAPVDLKPSISSRFWSVLLSRLIYPIDRDQPAS
jgi:hypothetical protein